MLLVNCLITFPIKRNSDFSNGPKSVPKNLPDSPILYNWAFDSSVLAEELYRSLETCALVNHNL